MYNTSYEEYMRTVLGYTPNCLEDTYATCDYCMNRMNECNLDNLYPDMYNKIYPLIIKECNSNTMPITQEILESMSDNVFNAIQIDLKIQTNIVQENRKEDTKNINTRQDNRNNNLLRDLIKILILRELSDRGRFPNRPPYFPGRPPMPGPRPPFPRGPIQSFPGNSGGIMTREY